MREDERERVRMMAEEFRRSCKFLIEEEKGKIGVLGFFMRMRIPAPVELDHLL